MTKAELTIAQGLYIAWNRASTDREQFVSNSEMYFQLARVAIAAENAFLSLTSHTPVICKSINEWITGWWSKDAEASTIANTHGMQEAA
jgi:hypothetical protein